MTSGDELKAAVDRLNAAADAALVRAAGDVDVLTEKAGDIMEEMAESAGLTQEEVIQIEQGLATADGKISGLDFTRPDTCKPPPA